MLPFRRNTKHTVVKKNNRIWALKVHIPVHMFVLLSSFSIAQLGRDFGSSLKKLFDFTPPRARPPTVPPTSSRQCRSRSNSVPILECNDLQNSGSNAAEHGYTKLSHTVLHSNKWSPKSIWVVWIYLKITCKCHVEEAKQSGCTLCIGQRRRKNHLSIFSSTKRP
jgi:hypothetical protein